MKMDDEGRFRLAIKGDTLFDRSGNEYRVEGRTSTPDGEWLCVGAVKPKPRVIDWSKVRLDIVPVKSLVTNTVSFYDGKLEHILRRPRAYSLESGKWVAWTEWVGGDEAPVPEGVEVEGLRRDGARITYVNSWPHRGIPRDVIAFRVTGLADGYCYSEEGWRKEL